MPVSLRQRTGATLTEVLMALLIMSVGVVSIFSLFPIAILSSIRATQLTNSKILEQNVEELVRTQPQLLRPPIPPGKTWRGEWQPNRVYNVADIVQPLIPIGHLFPNPNIVYECTAASAPRMSSISEPNWPTTGMVTDGNLTWTAVNNATNPGLTNYVVDPLGRFRDGNTALLQRFRFGYDGVNLRDLGIARDEAIARTSAGFSDYFTALATFSLPDTWSVDFEGIPTTVDPVVDAPRTVVTFPPGTELPANGSARVVLSTPLGTQTRTRFLTSVPINNSLTLAPPSVPAGFNGSLRIETFEPRYTYFLTVRRTSPDLPPQVHAVMMFNRGYNFSDEEVYEANFGNSAFTGVPQVVDNNLQADQVKIHWSASDPEPLMQEGNFLFDGRNAIWYEITNVNESANQAILTLDRPAEVITPTGANNVGRVILMPGIINVYEL